MSQFRPRPSQEAVISYSGGRMGVSAVPGSGKTHTLAELAARLVAESIRDGEEVLVVTLVNSAVDNLKSRIDDAIKCRRLLPGLGCRVRTLHALSHDIVRERPGLVGLSEDFEIADEQAAELVMRDATNEWLAAHPGAADTYLLPGMSDNRIEWIRKGPWSRLVHNLVSAFIKRAKDSQITPGKLETQMDLFARTYPDVQHSPIYELVTMAATVYSDYQRSLAHQGRVDFDDLVRLALVSLQSDAEYLERLQRRWPFVLEDEAQDSSMLQEAILELLSSRSGNWVRVGDPNQAIYETFTTAKPDLLLDFLGNLGDGRHVSLPVSGRSQSGIIRLANHLVDWVRSEHPLGEARGALTATHISPALSDDPQPNPPTDLTAIQLHTETMTPAEELHFITDRLESWAEEQQRFGEANGETCAVLSPTNQRGAELVGLLKQRQIPYVELLQSTTATRETAGALGRLLRCMADPTSPGKLSSAFRVWRKADRGQAEADARVERCARVIASCQHLEAYLWPGSDQDWLAQLALALPQEDLALLTGFREAACRWQRAAGLPVGQLVLALAGEVFTEPPELALAYKLSLLLQDDAETHPEYRLPQLVQDLEAIARNERRFLGFSDNDSAFVPPRGKVTVTTLHKAKGLEWDRVFLIAVNNYDFPSGQSHDDYRDEPSYVQGRLNLQEESLALLEAMASIGSQTPLALPAEGEATRNARIKYVAERLRLLYVGITRARKALTITSNSGKRSGWIMQPATPLLALESYWAVELSENE